MIYTFYIILKFLDQSVRRNSLVKWLENSQFDVNNEWVGRLTAVPHSSIIDFDTDDLKPGIEISVIRNNGEIWRAQVIIPKTSSNTIDLPPSSSKVIIIIMIINLILSSSNIRLYFI